MKVVAGSASVALAHELSSALGAEFLETAYEKHPGGFPDDERYVRVLGPLAGDEVVVVQSTHPDTKVVELLLLIDAVRGLRPRRVSLVIPYFGYGRQDKRFESGEALSAEVLARHLEVGVDEVLTMGLHNPDILKFFNVPTREVSGMPAVGRYLQGRDIDFILAPDDNAIRHAKEVAKAAGKPWDALSKTRIDSYRVKFEPKKLDVRGKRVAIVDDVISTGGTVALAAKELKQQGARHVLAAVVHGLFVASAWDKLAVCDEVAASDTIPSRATKFSVAPEFAAALRSETPGRK
ncbi:MAG TPA: ribose-phosphate diphosphokinase [Thermoplasmata archaeon]